jgi:hypothetical protein
MRQRNAPLKGLLKKSPVKQNYPTRDFSPEATKNTLGARLVERFTPENTVAGITSAVAGGGLLKNAPKIVRAVKSFFSS